MTNIPVPPKPPQNLFDSEKKLAIYSQMLADLEQNASYQQEAIAYHAQSLKLLEAEAATTQTELEACRNIIDSLNKTQQLAANVTLDEENKSNGYHPTEAEETAPVEMPAVQSKADKSKQKTAVKKSQTKTKSPKAKVKPQAQTKSKNKLDSTLPPSARLDTYENITTGVLDFVKKQDGVISSPDIVAYFYPDGLDQTQQNKVAKSFSSVLSLQFRKGILERTVPGKYMWNNKASTK
ncbi:hypothetical protein [Pleurocapsa sp. FMAR1]|uniref:hypothetical protein n=1 Tax=Pleurocapsa sp. FMAR1 TaxID=3040204 RepID=UPI0029C7D951|nr:hypothetical protein [Pleurocapsa sp. FMAR1]